MTFLDWILSLFRSPMLTSYKFWFIRRDDDGFITEVTVRFYEGQIKEVDEVNALTREIEKNMRYVRERRLLANELTHLASSESCKELSGDDCIIYTPSNFGQIKTVEELKVFLNSEIAKDVSREVIAEQK